MKNRIVKILSASKFGKRCFRLRGFHPGGFVLGVLIPLGIDPMGNGSLWALIPQGNDPSGGH